MEVAIVGLVSAVIVAVLTIIGNVIINRINRKDAVSDKDDEFKQEVKESFKEVNDALKCMRKKIDSMSDKADEREAIAARTRILRFGDEVYTSRRHSKDLFDMTLADIDYYENFCSTHPLFKNSITEMTVARIKEVYGECVKNHDFL